MNEVAWVALTAPQAAVVIVLGLPVVLTACYLAVKLFIVVCALLGIEFYKEKIK
jgi:hypothetical protein